MKEKVINIYYILIPVYTITTCIVASLWFIEYDKEPNIVPLTFGIITCFNYILSLVYLKLYPILNNGKIDLKDKLITFNAYNIINIFPLTNVIILAYILGDIMYSLFKKLIKSNNIKITY